MPAPRRTFKLGDHTYEGFLNVLDIAALERNTGSSTTQELLQRCMSVTGSFSILSLAAKNVSRRMDMKAFQGDFERQVEDAGLASLADTAAEILQDTGLFKNGEDDEEKKA